MYHNLNVMLAAVASVSRWVKCGVWGRYAGVDFAAVLAACQEVLDAKRLQALAAV